jgi:glycosyltransferase involved in cell wall biosynthesis
MLTALRHHYGDIENGCVINNGRDPNLFSPQISKENYALSVGRLWDGGKQLKLLCQKDLPLDCYVAGPDRHPDASLQAEHSLRTAELPNLHFLGTLSETALSGLYGRAAIYVATSRYEPFGLAPLEAAFSRCALVLNDLPVFRELWQEDAIYFERNDPESLLRSLAQAKKNPELCKEYGARALRRAQRQFTSNTMADSYLHLYQALVRSRMPLSA